MHDLKLIAEANGYVVSVVKDERVGYVVYEDENQVIAEPFAHTKTGGRMRVEHSSGSPSLGSTAAGMWSTVSYSQSAVATLDSPMGESANPSPLGDGRVGRMLREQAQRSDHGERAQRESRVVSRYRDL